MEVERRLLCKGKMQKNPPPLLSVIAYLRFQTHVFAGKNTSLLGQQIPTTEVKSGVVLMDPALLLILHPVTCTHVMFRVLEKS